jgi:hypothetical protein
MTRPAARSAARPAARCARQMPIVVRLPQLPLTVAVFVLGLGSLIGPALMV